MYPQQSVEGAGPGPSDLNTGLGGPSSFTSAPAAGASLPVGQQPQVPPAATSTPEQQQQQQPTSAGGGSPPKGGRFLGIFGRKQPADGTTSPPDQTTSPPGTSGGGESSPERRRMFGFFRRSNAMNDPQQQQGAQQQQGGQQQQQQQQQQQLQQPDQTGAAPSGGVYPAVPGAPGATQAGLAQAGVPVVPPATGLCARQPPPAEEVARLQSSPLAPSKFATLNQPPPLSTKPATSALASSPSGLAVDPQFHGPAPLEEKYGPFLRFGGYDPATRIYSASVMMVVHQSRSRYPPVLKYRDVHHHGTGEEVKNPVRLWSYAGYNFWRWDIAFQLGASPAVAEYHIVCSEDHFFTVHTRYHFHLPAAGQKWHWGFYSCNGFHDHNDEMANGGIQPLWRDVLRTHERDPIHVMFGGGDQLYCDDVWKVNSLLQWTGIQDKPSRNMHPFSQEMVNEVFDFYFRNYTTHFGKEVFRDALASIPMVMVWDDHDIFDGWGSYPPELQNCAVFAGVYFVARKFYLLFQCHAAEDNYRELNKGWGLTGLSWTVMLGNTTAVVGLDSRGERTRQQIIRPASWAAFADQIAKLPAGVRHVVVLATVPLVYPSVPGVEEAMMALAGTGLVGSAVTAFLQKTGLSSQIYSQFGEPELLDDLLDHWSARIHEVEKYCFVRMMQDVAEKRGIRFSILSGDVHCAGAAHFHSMPKVSLKRDHRYMVQVISSAIGNVPPPDAVIRALTASNKPKMLDPVTREKMRGIFENNGLLKGARNWCDIHERPLLQGVGATAAIMAGGISGGPADGSLVFQLRVEHPIYKESRPYTYDITVPLLEGTFVQGPLPEALPLPQPLMLRFQEELVAAGVGLDAALPVRAPTMAAATGGGATAVAAAAAVAGAPRGPSLTQVTAQTFVSSGTMEQHPPSLAGASAAAQQLQQLSFAEAPAQGPGQRQSFGLQSDIDQHSQQQPMQPPARNGPLGTAGSTGSYPAVGTQAGQYPQQSAPGGAQGPGSSYGGAPPAGQYPPGQTAGYTQQQPYQQPYPQPPPQQPPQQPYPQQNPQQPYPQQNPQQPYQQPPPQQPYQQSPPQQPYQQPPQQPYQLPQPQQPYQQPQPQQPYQQPPPQQPYQQPYQQPPPQQPYQQPYQQPPPQQPGYPPAPHPPGYGQAPQQGAYVAYPQQPAYPAAPQAPAQYAAPYYPQPAAAAGQYPPAAGGYPAPGQAPYPAAAPPNAGFAQPPSYGGGPPAYGY